MVRAWYMDDSLSDQRLPHLTDPPKFVSLDDLKARTGVEYYQIDADNFENDPKLQKLRKERGYNYEDQVNITQAMPQYEEKIKMFFEEHIHSDEEIRLVLDGTGYFDARDVEDQWIRIEVGKGDLIILPAGIYHRFTLDTEDYIKANRYFIGEPVWTPINRPAENADARKEYKKAMGIS